MPIVSRPVPEFESAGITAADCRELLDEGLPVVLRDAIHDWRASNLWTDSYLQRAAGDESIPFMQSRGSLFGPGCTEHHATLIEFLSVYRDRPDLYINGANLNSRLKADIGNHPMISAFSELEASDADTGVFFSAGKQTVAPHFDESENVYAVIDGENRVLLAPVDTYPQFQANETENQDEALFSGFLAEDDELQSVDWHLANLRAGDLLYIPNYWWHTVSWEGRHLSLSFVRSDRQAQLRAFRSLMAAGVFPLSDHTKDRIGYWFNNPAEAVQQAACGKVIKDIFEAYVVFTVAFIASAEDKALKALENKFAYYTSNVARPVLESRRDWPQSLAYLLQTFYRIETSRFFVPEYGE